jgi:hypothetical protein
MVLASLSFLVLALMMTLSFNLSQALRQKVSLQQHSDTLAYSMAVMEARAFNYYAVSNRAIAGSYVAMNSMHAYMAAASVTGEMMRASQINFYFIAAQEFGQCGCLTCFQHCLHGFEAIGIASDYARAGRSYDNKVKQLESSFNQTNKGLDLLVENVHASQKAVHLKTMQSVTDGQSNGLSELTDYNLPGATHLPAAVGALNAGEFNCAVDGMACMGGEPNSSVQARARVMSEVANASRPSWAASRKGGPLGPTYLHPRFLMELRKDIPGEGQHLPWNHKGTAKLVERRGDVNGSGQSGGNTGRMVIAEERGRMSNRWKHGVGPYWAYDASVWSDSGGGGHSPGGVHSGRHTFDGVNTVALESCIMRGNCFMKFRATPDASRDWGQPRVYSYVTKMFRVGDPAQAPWELTEAGAVTYKSGAEGAATQLSLAAGEGAGLSKALVYYHRFGANGWREAPNLFNPYWRAKLHPFKPEEAAKVLEAAGNSDAAQLAATPGVAL